MPRVQTTILGQKESMNRLLSDGKTHRKLALEQGVKDQQAIKGFIKREH
jgi:hypothetical protein